LRGHLPGTQVAVCNGTLLPHVAVCSNYAPAHRSTILDACVPENNALVNLAIRPNCHMVADDALLYVTLLSDGEVGPHEAIGPHHLRQGLALVISLEKRPSQNPRRACIAACASTDPSHLVLDFDRQRRPVMALEPPCALVLNQLPTDQLSNSHLVLETFGVLLPWN